MSVRLGRRRRIPGVDHWDGIRLSKRTTGMDGYLLASRTLAVVGGRPVRHGHAAQRHHDGQHHRPGLRGRHEVRAVLLRPADRHDHPVGDGRAVLLAREGLHRVRVPGASLRPEDAHAHRVSLPALPRVVLQRRHRRALADPVHRPRLESDDDGAGDWSADRHLHHGRRRAGRDLDRRQTDGHHRRRHSRGRGGADSWPA